MGAVLLLLVILAIIGVVIWVNGAPEPTPMSFDDFDAVQAEVAMRTFKTGNPHIANEREDGTWEIQELKGP